MGKRYKTMAKTASKKEEKALIQKAEALMDDPGLLIPDCQSSCRICPFRKLEKGLAKVASKGDKEKALEKMAKRGPGLVRAYAATLLLIHQGKAPYLGVLPFRSGTVSYAMRGTAKPDKLIAVQHYNDPWVRLVGYMDIVKRYGIHIYSSPSGFACTGEADAPDWYVKDVLKRTSLKGKRSCTHADDIGPCIELSWRSAKIDLRSCKKCDRTGNLLRDLVIGIAAGDPTDDFDVEVAYRPDGGCMPEVEIDDEVVRDYRDGEISNREFVDKFMYEVSDAVRREKVLIIDDKCMKKAELIDELASSEAERKALKVVFGKSGHLGWSVSTASVLQEHWSSLATPILKKLVPKNKVAKYASDKRPPIQIIQEAEALMERERKARELPRFEGLTPLGQVVQDAARISRVQTSTDAALALTTSIKDASEMRPKAVLLAFQKCVGARVEDWRFAEDERSYSEYLKPSVKKVIDCPVDEYRQNLIDLLKALGEETANIRNV